MTRNTRAAARAEEAAAEFNIAVDDTATDGPEASAADDKDPERPPLVALTENTLHEIEVAIEATNEKSDSKNGKGATRPAKNTRKGTAKSTKKSKGAKPRVEEFEGQKHDDSASDQSTVEVVSPKKTPSPTAEGTKEHDGAVQEIPVVQIDSTEETETDTNAKGEEPDSSVPKLDVFSKEHDPTPQLQDEDEAAQVQALARCQVVHLPGKVGRQLRLDEVEHGVDRSLRLRFSDA